MVQYWRGKPVDELTWDEAIAALKQCISTMVATELSRRKLDAIKLDFAALRASN